MAPPTENRHRYIRQHAAPPVSALKEEPLARHRQAVFRSKRAGGEVLRITRRASFLFFLLLSPFVAALAQPTNPGKVSVVEQAPSKKLLFLPFFNEAGDANYTWLESNIGASLHEEARKKYRYVKIDDRTFARYFAQNRYTSADLYNVEKVARIAKDLGADGVIFGRFKAGPSTALRDRPSTERSLSGVEATKGTIIVTGKILSVIDREIVGEKTVEMPVSAEMFAAVAEVSTALGANIKNLFYPSDKGAFLRAAVLPGWGHRYKQRPGWGYFWGGLFWSSVAFTAFSTFQYFRYTIGYENFSPEHFRAPSGGVKLANVAAAQTEFDAYEKNITLWGQMTIGGLIGVGVIYAANLLHAWGIAPDVFENVVQDTEQKGARLRFQLAPTVGIGSLRHGSQQVNLSQQMRGEVSLVWRF